MSQTLTASLGGERSTRSEHILATYVTKLVLTDATAVGVSVLIGHLGWFGFRDDHVQFTETLSGFELPYIVLSVTLAIVWMLLLAGYHTYDERQLGSGTEEYRHVVSVTFTLFGALAIASYLLQGQLARGYFLTVLPLGLTLLLLGRWAWRQWLVAQRKKGLLSSRVVIVGGLASASTIARDLLTQPESGLHIVGACVTDQKEPTTLLDADVPVVGSIDSTLAAMRQLKADTLIVTASQHLTPNRIRRISWGLEPGRQHLILAPSIVDVAGPRIHTRPVAGLPLVQVQTPRFDGRTLFAKRLVDILASGIALLLLSPVFLVTAVAVKSSPGPVFFKQERVGLRGSTFRMWKFRSMVVDAEEQLKKLHRSQDEDVGNMVMFKMKNDPRITKVGKFIRRYSIDELPQLINVFKGDMSLVGPRPPLPREVALYETDVRRKFLVKPGITGLWQVSGRSKLSWEEAVRLDLYYVENWSMTGDFQILLRTVKAVLAKDGAY